MNLRSLVTLALILLVGCQAAPKVVISERPALKSDSFRIDSPDKIHLFLGPITVPVALAVILAVDAAEKQKKAVLIEIDSPGGHVQAASLIIKKLERASVPVTCLVDGAALSSALLIIAACPKRQATERSRLMFHQPFLSGEIKDAHIADLIDMAKQLMALWVSLCHELASKTKLSAETWFEKTDGKEFWMTAQDALQNGVIDEVVPALTYKK